ncbi:MAG: hypothetical protein AB7U75_22105 [Hyphomicrobiaceae bacterium]
MAEVAEAIIALSANAGATLAKQTPNQLTFQKKLDSVMASALLGTRYDFNVYSQSRFTLYQAGDATEVIVECATVQNAGSAFEKELDSTHTKDCEQAQLVLDYLNKKLSAR